MTIEQGLIKQGEHLFYLVWRIPGCIISGNKTAKTGACYALDPKTFFFKTADDTDVRVPF